MSEMPGVSNAFQLFLKNTPQFSAPYMDMIAKLGQASALDAKTRELAFLAVLAAAGATSGVAFHATQARSLGASREEIISAILVGLPAVGTVVVQSLPAAFEALAGK